MICMCALINSKQIEFSSRFELTNSVLTITFIFICSVLPILITVFLLVKFSQLGNPEMVVKFGELTKDLDLSSGRKIIMTPINFLVRRYFLVVGVLYCSQLFAQIYIVLGGVLASLISTGVCDSFTETSVKRNEFFNEVIISNAQLNF